MMGEREVAEVPADGSVVCVSVRVQAKAQFYLRTHMADESKNEYAAQLQNFNAEQWKHFNNAVPHIFKVEARVVYCSLCSCRDSKYNHY